MVVLETKGGGGSSQLCRDPQWVPTFPGRSVQTTWGHLGAPASALSRHHHRVIITILRVILLLRFRVIDVIQNTISVVCIPSNGRCYMDEEKKRRKGEKNKKREVQHRVAHHPTMPTMTTAVPPHPPLPVPSSAHMTGLSAANMLARRGTDKDPMRICFLIRRGRVAEEGIELRSHHLIWLLIQLWHHDQDGNDVDFPFDPLPQIRNNIGIGKGKYFLGSKFRQKRKM